jgi:uncharacterized protein with LGFP repeats
MPQPNPVIPTPRPVLFADADRAIGDKHGQLGGDNGLLGLPVGDTTECPDRVGFFRHFRNGSIYFHPDLGAHEVHGAIRDKWASMGWERSFLGYPVTDETVTPDGVGRFNHFQGGSTFWTPATGAHELHGAIREKWASLGWERSYLGYPTSDEMDAPGDERISIFEGGSITWTADRGAIATRVPR